MISQPEQALEDNLVEQLTTLGYEKVLLRNEDDIIANLKTQLEKHNDIKFSGDEFKKVLNHLDSGKIFDKAKILRDKMQLDRDDGSNSYIEFINQEQWCQNQYQVTQQITMEGKYRNRYDVTLLVNGLPLVQIELKRRGLEIKEAFNQINRYQRHSFAASYGLFQYIQLFVISNGVNTKYYANKRRQTFKQTFYWTDKNNNRITQLDQFAEHFLEKCHISKMICKYIALHESDKILMALRPYQYYAVEAIVEQVKNGRKNGYIWHTTGSGKTLTSFKAAQILRMLPKVHKIVFVVDRSDLDYQTTREFNFFSDGSVDGTDNTHSLVKQLKDETPLIVTTIQKLNTAIRKKKYLEKIEHLKDKRIVFIFDECHRSQFGETHQRITDFFEASQMFGFTGTPIFAETAVRNAQGKRTTKDLFGECLHKYVIKDAILDENVLRFAIEYWDKAIAKSDNNYVEEVKGISKKESFEGDKRLSVIVKWITEHHESKTHNKEFTSIFCVSSVPGLIKYYEIFKKLKEQNAHNLRIATIFTYGVNENDLEADGMIEDVDFDAIGDKFEYKHSREKLDDFVSDYNKMYKTKFSTKDSKGFYGYYKDIAKRIKEREKVSFQDKDRLDILLVVNMYLTGFDAKKVNTLYVDKNLKYHSLIQAYSRTNRILNEKKSHGNIVCFRNLKQNTDDAIALFSNKDALEDVLLEPYEKYVEKFNDGVKELKSIAPTVDSVNVLQSEKEELAFVQSFRNLMRIKNVLTGFSKFKFDDLDMQEQEFEDYKSKYLDIYDKYKSGDSDDGSASIIDDIDFELELIQRDEINVAYILELLAALQEKVTKLGEKPDKKLQKEHDTQKKRILDLLGNEAQLRSKRKLIAKFIEEHLPNVKSSSGVKKAFKGYWNDEKIAALDKICVEEGLHKDKVEMLVEDFLFSGIMPDVQQVAGTRIQKLKILERKTVTDRIKEKLLEFIRIFDDDMGDI